MVDKKYKTIYYGFAFIHHKNTKGGYHNIKNFVLYDQIFDLQLQKNFFDITLEKNFFFKIIKKLYFIFFNQIGIFQLLNCAFILIFKKNHLIHFIYPENTYSWLHKIKNKSNKIVCTFHQPPTFYINSKKWVNVIKNIDGIIVLNKKDINFFKNISNKNNVIFIPHGIDADFFQYDYRIIKEASILLVGNWLRNFLLAQDVFIELNKRYPEIKIDIVVNSENIKYFKNLNVNIHNNISDNEIKYLYQKSTIVYFPLYDFTANNAMLEALSCGTNILISTDKTIDDSYLKSNYFIVTKNDVYEICDIIYELIYLNNINVSHLKEMSNYCQENFSWNNIGNKTNDFFASL
jgi:glycosyltransferase involved in cell wall biosynthesis